MSGNAAEFAIPPGTRRLQECLELRVKDIDFAERGRRIGVSCCRTGSTIDCGSTSIWCALSIRRTLRPGWAASCCHRRWPRSSPMLRRNGSCSSCFRLDASAETRSMTAVAVSPARERHSTCGHRGRALLGRREASQLPYLPALVRDASSRGWLRYPDRPGVVGPWRHQHDDDLHARPEPGRAGGKEPAGSALTRRAGAHWPRR
jgi:hypothetical protein